MNTTPDKKMTPMEELIEQLKKLSPESPMDNDVSKAFHVGIKLAILKAKFLLEAEREYASQQAPASNQPVSAMEDGFTDYRIYHNDKVNSILAAAIRFLNTEQLVVLKDCLIERTPKK